MKNTSSLVLIILLLLTGLSNAQTTSQIYSSAMDAYNATDYSRAINLFEDFFQKHSTMDELFATARSGFPSLFKSPIETE